MSNELIDFHAPTEADRGWIKAASFRGLTRSCDYSFANVMTWSGHFQSVFAEVAGRITSRVGAVGNSYSWGAGDEDHLEEFVRLLEADASARGEKLSFCCVDDRGRAYLEAHYPDRFTFDSCEGAWDYCYLIENLANLPGSKFQKKRNHIHAFETAFPNWRVEPITSANLELCRTIARAWDAEDRAEGTCDTNSQDGESALYRALSHVVDWKLDGLILFDGEKPVAFSMGERLSTTFYDVLYEKAPRDLRGAYPMINREFARFIAQKYPEIRYLNREDSMGEPHLQKAKESYHPDLLVPRMACWSK